MRENICTHACKQKNLKCFELSGKMTLQVKKTIFHMLKDLEKLQEILLVGQFFLQDPARNHILWVVGVHSSYKYDQY